MGEGENEGLADGEDVVIGKCKSWDSVWARMTARAMVSVRIMVMYFC